MTLRQGVRPTPASNSVFFPFCLFTFLLLLSSFWTAIVSGEEDKEAGEATNDRLQRILRLRNQNNRMPDFPVGAGVGALIGRRRGAGAAAIRSRIARRRQAEAADAPARGPQLPETSLSSIRGPPHLGEQIAQ